MAFAGPERREELAQALRMARFNRGIEQWTGRREEAAAPLRSALERRPLSSFPHVVDALWGHYQEFAPGLRLDDRPPPPSVLRAREAYALAQRGKLDAALRKLDTLIAGLKHDADAARYPTTLANVCMFAGAVGYCVCDETSGAYYAMACEAEPDHKLALLVLGAVLLRLGRRDEARITWGRALQVEQARFAEADRNYGGSGYPGHRESMEGASQALKTMEAMVLSLDAP